MEEQRVDAAVPSYGELVALSLHTACRAQRLIAPITYIQKRIRQDDIVEAMEQRRATLKNLPPPNVAGVDDLARRIDMLHKQNISVILVGHSQGALMVHDAMYKLPQIQNHPINSDSTCVGLLALASPIPLSAYDNVVARRMLRALTASGDILDYGSIVDQGIEHFDSQRSSDLNQILLQYDGNPAGLRLSYGFLIHEVSPNYFTDVVGSGRVQTFLNQLVNECVNTPQP